MQLGFLSQLLCSSGAVPRDNLSGTAGLEDNGQMEYESKCEVKEIEGYFCGSVVAYVVCCHKSSLLGGWRSEYWWR